MATRIQLRKGTAAQWTLKNPVLLSGEAGVETDTHLLKLGDGTSTWSVLPYTGSVGGSGSAFLSGTSVPSSGTGSDGDFYLQTTTLVLYGPKSGSTWPVVGNLNDDTIGGPGGDSEVIWTLPEVDGNPGQVMTTDGLGNLEWTTPTLLFMYDLNGYTLANYSDSDLRALLENPKYVVTGDVVPVLYQPSRFNEGTFAFWNTKKDGSGVTYHTPSSVTIGLSTVVLYAQRTGSGY